LHKTEIQSAVIILLQRSMHSTLKIWLEMYTQRSYC